MLLTQYDANELEDLLREVMENEAPPTAPLPSLEDSDEEEEPVNGESKWALHNGIRFCAIARC